MLGGDNYDYQRRDRPGCVQFLCLLKVYCSFSGVSTTAFGAQEHHTDHRSQVSGDVLPCKCMSVSILVSVSAKTDFYVKLCPQVTGLILVTK